MTRTDPHPVFRDSGISYLHIPAWNPRQAARFYHGVFGWDVRGSFRRPGFQDGTGHVIGRFITDQAPAGSNGVRPYVYVANVRETLAAVAALGGEAVTAPSREGDLIVATFRDPAGNVLGVWQRAEADRGSPARET